MERPTSNDGSWIERFTDTHDNKEMIRRKPSPTSACEDNMLRVVPLDSTQTQSSSKYFLFSNSNS